MHILVLGAGYAGVTAALRLARETASLTGDNAARITLVNARDHFVERIRLHQVAVGQQPPVRSLAAFFAGTAVEIRIGAVEAIDLSARAVRVAGESLAYDRLVLALGSRVDVESVPGAREHAFTLDAQRADELAAQIPQLAAAGGKLAIVGTGLTAIEIATELAESWPRLRIALVGDLIAHELSERARAYVRQQLTAAGIELLEGVRVERVDAGTIATDRGPIACDACVWCAGFRAPSIVAEAGFDVQSRGRVRVDECLRSLSHPDVYVAGDVAALAEGMGAPLPMGCKSAEPAGLHVGRNLARELRGQSPRPLGLRPPAYCMSLGRRDAVLQLRGRDGTMTGPIVTGRFAARIKEWICQSTIGVIRLEQWLGRRRGAERALAPMAAGG